MTIRFGLLGPVASYRDGVLVPVRGADAAQRV
jgi:hypothetical protein